MLAGKETLLKEHERQFEEELSRLHLLFREKEISFDGERKSLISNINLGRAQKEQLERQIREIEGSKFQLEERLKQLTQTHNQTTQQLASLQQSLSMQDSKNHHYELTIEELTK